MSAEGYSLRRTEPATESRSENFQAPARAWLSRRSPSNGSIGLPVANPLLQNGKAPIGCLLASMAFIIALSGTLDAAPAVLAKRAIGTPKLVQPIAVFEPDDRRLIGDGYPELRERIGILTHTETQSTCTAFCVAPDIVATAGHCVSGTTAQSAGDPARLRFRRDGTNGPGIPIKSRQDGSLDSNIMTGAWRLNTRPPINASTDWAILRLSKAACPTGGLRLSNRTSDEVTAMAANGRIYNIAYHRDLEHWKLANSRPCSIVTKQKTDELDRLQHDFDRPNDLLLHTCDTEAASSGSPLLIDGERGPEVVGINIGTYVRSRVVTYDGEIIERLESEVISNTALLASTLISPLAEFNAGQLLSTSNEIEQLQNYLFAVGLDVGSRDGRIGPRTRKAIENYEARAGLPITGLATRSLLQRLQQTIATRAERSVTTPF